MQIGAQKLFVLASFFDVQSIQHPLFALHNLLSVSMATCLMTAVVGL
jgi:hypothetical protein